MKIPMKNNKQLCIEFDDSEELSGPLAVLIPIGIVTLALAIWFLVDCDNSVVSLAGGAVSLTLACVTAFFNLILLSSTICIFTKDKEIPLTAEERAQREKQVEEARVEQERIEHMTPHEYLMYCYPTEADLPEGITYQELEKVIIDTDSGYNPYIHHTKRYCRDHFLNEFIANHNHIVAQKKAIADYEARYGVSYSKDKENIQP